MLPWPCTPLGPLAPALSPAHRCPRCGSAPGARGGGKQGCQHGCGAVPREVTPSRACSGQRLPCRGPREPLTGAACRMYHDPGWTAQPCSATRPTRCPQGHRDAACRANNSWRTNNLKGWSMDWGGGKPSWEHPQQHPPGSAHKGSAHSWPRQKQLCHDRGVGVPWWKSSAVPSGSPVVPQPLWARRAAVGRAGQALALFLPHAQLVATQVVIEGLHVGEDALGVGLLPHDHHVFDLHQRHAVHQRPAETEPSAWPRVRLPRVGAGTGTPRCPGSAGVGTAALGLAQLLSHTPPQPALVATALLLARGRAQCWLSWQVPAPGQGLPSSLHPLLPRCSPSQFLVLAVIPC